MPTYTLLRDALGAMDHTEFDLVPRMPLSAPERTTRQDTHATLLVSWWCTGFALVIIVSRLCGRYSRSGKLFAEDKVMALSILPLMIRMALIHPVMLFGTNNTQLEGVGPQEAHERSIGSRLVLASRIFYALFIWIAKFTVSEFLKRLIKAGGVWTKAYEIVLQVIRIFLVVTFFAVVIATLAECRPFDHYWQVIPDPGPDCRDGYAQLITMGSCDIVTDLLLIIFPIPIIVKSSMPAKRKLSLCLLFSLSIINIAITAYRIAAIINVHGKQQRRTLWASIEILAAAAVSNALILGSFVRDRGTKKAKFKGASRTGSVDQPSINRIMTQQHWGNDSDEDLFRSLACRLNSVDNTNMMEANKPKPAPKALTTLGEDAATNEMLQPNAAWFSKQRNNADSASIDGVSPTETRSRERVNGYFATAQAQQASTGYGPSEMSFHDAGGILDGNDNTASPAHSTVAASQYSTIAYDWAPASRRGSTLSGPQASTVTTASHAPLNPLAPIETEEASSQGQSGQPDSSPQQSSSTSGGGIRTMRFGSNRKSQSPRRKSNAGDLQDPGGLLS